MAEFLELMESLDAGSASIDRLLSDGDGARPLRKRDSVAWLTKVGRFTEMLDEAMGGSRRAMATLSEAQSTSDFPDLFGDVLSRTLLGGYAETPITYPAYVRVNRDVRDFRAVKLFGIDGGEDVLDKVKELSEYPEASLSDSVFQYVVEKRGRRMGFSWESWINDDLGALRNIPMRFGRAARRSEERFATTLFAGATGPLGTFFTGGNANIVTGNPVLSIAALQTAFTVLSNQRDTDGEPIAIKTVHLVVPPALLVVAQNILNATQIEVVEVGGTANQKLIAANWMKNLVQLHVNPYLPVVSTTNGATSWYLFADPADGRPALEMGFLRGHAEPAIFVKEPNARLVSGSDPFPSDFETDSIAYKVRHVYGGTQIDPKMAVASNGTGV